MARPAMASMGEHSERHRRRAVWWTYAFVVLLPIEGLVRKWLLPSANAPFLFIRDPVALIILLEYLLYRAPRIPTWLVLWFMMLALALVTAIAQSIAHPYPLPVYLIGLRNHFLFIPMALAMADIFRREDLRRMVSLFCLLSVPIAILVTVQFFSPPEAAINKGVGDDPNARVFQVVAGIVRPYGPFTFVLGQSTFSALLLAIVVAGFDRSRAWQIPRQLLLTGLAAVIVMGVLSGSRTFFLSAFMIAACYLLGGLASRRIDAALRRAAATMVGAIGFVVVLIFVFPSSFEAITQRQEDAVASEGATEGRIAAMLSPIPVTGPGLTVFGEGLGIGSNAGGAYATGTTGFQLSEFEMPRLFQECGILLGSLLLGVRILLVLIGVGRSLGNARRYSASGGFALVGFVAPTVLLVSMSGQNQAIAIAWLGIGLMLAMTRPSVQQDVIPANSGPPLQRGDAA